MRILVTAPTEFELTPFRQSNLDAETLVTGVGIAATVYNLHKQLIQKKYDMVLQLGVAGVYDHQLPLTNVVAIAADRFADMGCIEDRQFNHLASLNLMDDQSYPYQQGWLVNPHLHLFQELPQDVHANTVNLLTDQIQHIQSIKGEAVVESMEGAALHYVCMNEGVPFLQIRGISNIVGDRNKSHWQLSEAIINVCAVGSMIYQHQNNR